jgi:hypothetical protein
LKPIAIIDDFTSAIPTQETATTKWRCPDWPGKITQNIIARSRLRMIARSIEDILGRQQSQRRMDAEQQRTSHRPASGRTQSKQQGGR